MKVELLAVTPDAEAVIERAGRTCYQSQDRISEISRGDFIRSVIKRGHLSVIEHAYATFRITGGSRAMTHQLVRHRLMAISQQSQRYVNEENFHYVIPETIRDSKLLYEYNAFMEGARQFYLRLQKEGIRNQDARFVLPNAVKSEIVISANFREFRHIFNVRCSKHAQWEIREAALLMLEILKLEAPAVFGDYVIYHEARIAKSEGVFQWD